MHIDRFPHKGKCAERNKQTQGKMIEVFVVCLWNMEYEVLKAVLKMTLGLTQQFPPHVFLFFILEFGYYFSTTFSSK